MTRSVFTPQHDLLCRLLADAREAAGITQEELAARLRRPQSFVSKYEHGERRLDLVEFLEVTEAIGVDPTALIRRLCPRKKRSSR